VTTITVIIPTYRRPQDLSRCLEALKRQTRLPDEILVVVRDSDAETRAFLKEIEPGPLALRTVKLKAPGVVAALNAGLGMAQGDIIALTDDDAAPHLDWLARIVAHVQADSKVGGVGGRYWNFIDGQWDVRSRRVVGKVQWFGRGIGNHHLGVGGPREVDALAGGASAYRRVALQHFGFDRRMRGTGAQVHWELSLGLQLKRAGWRLIYDPAVSVDHYPGTRFDEDQRNKFGATSWSNMVHNETLAILEHLPPLRRLAFVLWALFVGTRSGYGLVQWLRFLPHEGGLAGAKLRASLRGRMDGWKTWRRDNA